ncbi:hypothetical protein JNJ66_01495 [Candidatus Saccharibacteria bacterium]|nr:hypothetical protein [Candidatus Saccharibacteria bacterium]
MNMQPTITRHEGRFRYDTKDMPFQFWSCTTDMVRAIDTVIFLGSAQRGKVVRWVAESAPAGTVVVEGLPHREADRSARNLEDFASSFTRTALQAVRRTYKSKELNIVAESQAVPGVVFAALESPELIGNVILAMPLGFTADALGDTPRRRLRTLKWRAFLSALQALQTPALDRRTLHLTFLAAHALLIDSHWRLSGQKYAYGVSRDLRPECRQLAGAIGRRGKKLTLLLGERDKIFPESEVRRSLEEAAINTIAVEMVDAPHVSLAIRGGERVLKRAVAIARA